MSCYLTSKKPNFFQEDIDAFESNFPMIKRDLKMRTLEREKLADYKVYTGESRSQKIVGSLFLARYSPSATMLYIKAISFLKSYVDDCYNPKIEIDEREKRLDGILLFLKDNDKAHEAICEYMAWVKCRSGLFVTGLDDGPALDCPDEPGLG